MLPLFQYFVPIAGTSAHSDIVGAGRQRTMAFVEVVMLEMKKNGGVWRDDP